MKISSSNPHYHIVYWCFILMILTLVFGQKWESSTAAFYFICMLMPIVLGTSYFFNYHLVPKFLLTKRYFRFSLYTVYTIIVSLYLEYIVLMYAFVYLGQYSFLPFAPNAHDTVLLGVILYLLVILGSVLLMIKQIKEKQAIINQLLQESKKIKMGALKLRVNRQYVKLPFDDICYIESLSDYIKVHMSNRQGVSSKEKISHLAERLPKKFLRIHRSYIVNTDKIRSASRNEIALDENVLPVGRSYKAAVKERVLQPVKDQAGSN
ncbi:LytR/AlgR family response regulator transcription factor [Carboxylicivirga taeanensis]|uniref:LytR/AlgR family response regulator transcription factor n=1 Tax=Carboxylicivirga taeanensis TaxID=1416875 RepID=UPI003F6E434D